LSILWYSKSTSLPKLFVILIPACRVQPHHERQSPSVKVLATRSTYTPLRFHIHYRPNKIYEHRCSVLQVASFRKLNIGTWCKTRFKKMKTFRCTFKMGMMPSFAIACSKRGAPVNDCKPAPIVDMNAPSKTTHLLGQANMETISSLPRLSPNLPKHHIKYVKR